MSDPPLTTHVKFGEFKPVCPVCGKDHPPIECLAKALKFSSSSLIPIPPFLVKALAAHPSLVVIPIHGPGCRCRHHGARNIYRDLPPVRIRSQPVSGHCTNWKKKYLRAYCKTCKTRALRSQFLDYVYCPRCNKALTTKNLRWTKRKGARPSQAKQNQKLMLKRAKKRRDRKRRREK